MKKSMMSILSFAVMIYIACCAMLYAMQRNFIYMPTAENTSAQNSHKINKLQIESQDEILKVWQINHASEYAVIYFGGNAEDVSWNIAPFSQIFSNHNIYLVNYRGYGGSSGTPSEQALYTDALNIFDQLQSQYKHISVIGRSLGSGVATYVASARTVYKLILVTPFDSIENIAKRSFPLFPISLLLKDKYNSAARAPSIQSPTLIIIAEHDEIIPRANSETLAAAFTQTQLSVKTIQDSGHNTIDQSLDYANLLNNFL